MIGNMDVSIDNTAILEAVQSLAGSGNQDTTQNTCTKLKSTQSTCKYIKQRNCCVNKVNEGQINEIKSCGNVDNTNMANASLRQAVCSGDITTTQADDMAGDLKSTETVKASQFAMGTLIALAIIGVLSVLAAGLVKYMNIPC